MARKQVSLGLYLSVTLLYSKLTVLKQNSVYILSEMSTTVARETERGNPLAIMCHTHTHTPLTIPQCGRAQIGPIGKQIYLFLFNKYTNKCI